MMPTYEFRCDQHGAFTLRRNLTEQTTTANCVCTSVTRLASASGKLKV